MPHVGFNYAPVCHLSTAVVWLAIASSHFLSHPGCIAITDMAVSLHIGLVVHPRVLHIYKAGNKVVEFTHEPIPISFKSDLVDATPIFLMTLVGSDFVIFAKALFRSHFMMAFSGAGMWKDEHGLSRDDLAETIFGSNALDVDPNSMLHALRFRNVELLSPELHLVVTDRQACTTDCVGLYNCMLLLALACTHLLGGYVVCGGCVPYRHTGFFRFGCAST